VFKYLSKKENITFSLSVGGLWAEQIHQPRSYKRQKSYAFSQSSG